MMTHDIEMTHRYAHVAELEVNKVADGYVIYRTSLLGAGAEGALREAVASPDLAGVLIRRQPKVGYTDYAELRLFRRDPRIRPATG